MVAQLLVDPTLILLKQITVDMFSFKKIHPIDFIPCLVHLTLIQSVRYMFGLDSLFITL